MTDPLGKPWRASYLSVSEAYNLDLACRPLNSAFPHYSVFHVGSSLKRPDYRDVDVRSILKDTEFDKMFAQNLSRLRLLNTAISEWLAARTGLPIDFQFQRATDANAEFEGERNAVGIPESAQ